MEEHEELQAKVTFLQQIVSKGSDSAVHIDNQVNILIGISVAIFAFASTKISDNDPNSFIFYVLGIFAAITSLVSLIAIHPPRFMRKKGQKESIFYNKYITSLDNSEKYREKIREVLTDPNKMFDEYASEIYNLFKYYYRPKRELFKLARNILFIGITLALILFLFGI